MKLDTKALRYLTNEDWRVLTAVETGSRNHEVVPTPLIVSLSGLRSANSGVQRSISVLAKANLVAKVKNAKYDGYRLTYGGLDYLALHALQKQSAIYSVGNQIGVGKESDIYVVADTTGKQYVLKLHRLGRISFRTVKNNRDYTSGRSSRHKRAGAANAGSYWMYMSKLAALKEYTFMQKLWEHGMPVPEPRAQNRHAVVMGLVDGFPMRQIKDVEDVKVVKRLYAELIALVMRLASFGLIHGDFNEFNIMLREEEKTEEKFIQVRTRDQEYSNAEASNQSSDEQESPASSATASSFRLVPTVIDFPQLLSISHPDSKTYFQRDVACVQRFFERRFRFISSEDSLPTFEEALREAEKVKEAGGARLDVEAEASGFSKGMEGELRGYMKGVGAEGLVEDRTDDDEEGAGVENGSDDEEDEDYKADDGGDEHGQDDNDGFRQDRLQGLKLEGQLTKRPAEARQQAAKAQKAASGWVI